MIGAEAAIAYGLADARIAASEQAGLWQALADTAFAYACNSRNQFTVAAGADINFVSSAREGDTLIAEGIEQHRGGRSGVYDVRVSNQDGKLVALEG